MQAPDPQRHELLAKAPPPEIAQADLIRELQIGFDQADEGQFVEFDPEAIKAEGRRRQDREASGA